jgi:chemotaxis protein MotB
MKVISVVLGVLVLVLAGICYYFYDANKKRGRELQASYGIKSELESKVADISRERQGEVARLTATYDKMVKEMKEEIEQGQIKIRQLSDRLSVVMVDQILFPSGEAEITPEGMAILTRIGGILKNTRGKIIRVEGHTDNVRISPQLQQKFPTNWELSTTRATNVVRFFQDTVGIKGARLRAVGMSEYHPVASNETHDGRAQNRRIEIALLPEPFQQTP